MRVGLLFVLTAAVFLVTGAQADVSDLEGGGVHRARAGGYAVLH